MAINYYLTEATLPAIAGKYTAKVISTETVNIDSLARDIAQAGMSASESEVKSIISQACVLIEQHLTAGRRVQLGGIVNMGASIKGTFDDGDSPMDPEFNFVEVTASAGARVRKSVKDNSLVERIAPPTHNPLIQKFLNVTTDVANSEIGPSDLARITGTNLDFDNTDPDQGLFYVDVAGVLADVKVTTIAKAGDKEVTFQTPVAVSTFSTCYLQVRRRQSPSSSLITGKSADLTLE